MFGSHRYSDICGNDIPDDVWRRLETEEDLETALGGVAVGQDGVKNLTEKELESELESEDEEVQYKLYTVFLRKFVKFLVLTFLKFSANSSV